ncbi:hypothetical protein WL24_22165 [Burkholderia ubonensis]|nr:hypothetical protein WL24_22165 [Burkholderia ubonensis]
MILSGEFPLFCGVMRDAIKMLLNSRILLPIVYSGDAMPLSNCFFCVSIRRDMGSASLFLRSLDRMQTDSC